MGREFKGPLWEIICFKTVPKWERVKRITVEFFVSKQDKNGGKLKVSMWKIVSFLLNLFVCTIQGCV